MARLSQKLAELKQFPAQAGTFGPVSSLHHTHVCRRVLPFSSSSDGCLRNSRSHSLRSTSTMGTSMVDEYPTLFRDSFIGHHSLLSLTSIFALRL